MGVREERAHRVNESYLWLRFTAYGALYFRLADSFTP